MSCRLLTVLVTFAVAVCGAVVFCSDQGRAASPGDNLYLDGGTFAQTASGLQQALSDRIAACGTVTIPANVTVTISRPIIVPSCLTGPHILQGSGDTTVLQFTTPAAQLIQSSGTIVRNLRILSRERTPAVGGEIYSHNTNHVQVDAVSFLGGGTHIDYEEVSNFNVSHTVHLSLTALGNAIRVDASTRGRIIEPHVQDFTPPASNAYYGGAIRIGGGSSYVEVLNPIISNLDGTTVRNYAGVDISASHNVSLSGGVISGLKNGDGVVTEDGATDVTITGTSSTGNSDSPGAGPWGNNGDGFDIYNSARVHLSNCIGDNNGNLASNLQRGAEIFTSEDVTVSNCDLSDNGAEGVIVAGSPRTSLVGVTANHNRLAGTYFLAASGHVLVSNAEVTLSDGVGFGLAWQPGTRIKIGSAHYLISSVTDGSHLLLAESAGASKSLQYSVDSYSAELCTGTFNGNGSSGKMRHGIYLADATNAVISGVRATDDRKSAKVQRWGADLENEATAIFINDDFRGNGAGDIQDHVGKSQKFTGPPPEGLSPGEPPCSGSRLITPRGPD